MLSRRDVATVVTEEEEVKGSLVENKKVKKKSESNCSKTKRVDDEKTVGRRDESSRSEE